MLDAALAKNLRRLKNYSPQKGKKGPQIGIRDQNTGKKVFWNIVCQIQIILQLLKKFVLIWNTLKLLP